MEGNTEKKGTGFDEMLNVDAVPYDDGTAAFVAESRRNREQCYQMSKRMAEEIAADGNRFREYLDLQSKFERYAANNVLLLMAQKPDAERIGDYRYWRRQGAYIERREQPILIMEPGKEYEREDGSVGTFYNAKKVYDISQTTLRRKMKPEEMENKRDIEDKKLIEALVYRPPVRIVTLEPDRLPGGKGALFVPEEECIYVRKGMSAGNIFKSVALELCHAELAKRYTDYNRNAYLFHAYSASYMLAKKYGMEVGNYNFSDVPEVLKGMEPQDIRAELNIVRDTFSTVSSRMEQVLGDNQRQRQKQGREEAR